MGAPADGHVHSEWSWDARFGSMDRTCSRAVRLGLPAIAFTEHVDFTPFRAGSLADAFGPLVTDGVLTAPAFDLGGYLDAVERCRATYPAVRILTGMEVGQPHRHGAELAALLGADGVDRVLGSLHCLPDGETFAEPDVLFATRSADDVFTEYLAEIPRMVSGSDAFDVFAHIDYPVRYWPEHAPPFDPRRFEEGMRAALGAIAAADRALGINAKVPLDATILRWWREEGGRRVTFGSDGHEPWTVGRGLGSCVALAEAAGFRADSSPDAPWFV